jgi:hypothetical protein
MERSAARVLVRDDEEAAIKQAIKENIQNIKAAQKEQEEKQQERVVICPVGIPSTDEKENNDKNRPIPITQECDNVIEEEANDVIGPKISFLIPRQFHTDALYYVVGHHNETDELKASIGSINMQIPLEEIAGAGVVNPETGEMLTEV